ncbi:hypothetical protein BS78_01G131000 [Paspalum vaginatum]|nr:hypothetical protein BS78_01G131000 [Paspalum vaginatum]
MTFISPLYCCLTFWLLLAQLARSAPIPPPSGPSRGTNEPQPSHAYIVFTDHVAKPPHFATLEHWYTSMVASPSPAAHSAGIFHVYDTVVHGFAAKLTVDEARRLSNTPGVAGVFKDRAVQLHTTRSPRFLGLDMDYGIWRDTDLGDGIIIGFVDTGIWPESASFNDSGLAPVRASWKGRCLDGERFNASMCNNKLVGAWTFTPVTRTEGSTTTRSKGVHGGVQSPRDRVGHGTYVASTAAGSEVPGAGFFEFASGSARGVAPRAKVAMYKMSSSTVSVVAAIDAAVKDGVDILSLSIGLGGDPNEPDPNFYQDPMAIALFGAVRAGIFVACSAGNFGPEESTLRNVAPWITTVGAATLDRVCPATMTLGDGQVLTGQSLYAHTANRTGFIQLLLSSCDDEDLVPDRIMGKIVVCAGANGVAVQKAGGSGLVTVFDEDWRMDVLAVQAFTTLPSLSLGARESEKLKAYVRSEPYPAASFGFACRTILKPDVIAPGTNILAARPDESRRASFSIKSGTSMSCPHVAGAAALLKRRHPDWTPAMIRSALMTTATTLDSQGRPIADNDSAAPGRAATPMAAGAGHVRPQQAADPGLVYDAAAQDYVDLLCTLNYTAAQIRLFAPDFAGCARTLPGGVGGLNYPSIVADLSNGTGVRVLTRTVTKVSEGPETYTVKVAAPSRLVEVTVSPRTLEFGGERYEKRSYTVVLRSKKSTASAHRRAGMTRLGQIVGENEEHRVRSPAVFILS